MGNELKDIGRDIKDFLSGFRKKKEQIMYRYKNVCPNCRQCEFFSIQVPAAFSFLSFKITKHCNNCGCRL